MPTQKFCTYSDRPLCMEHAFPGTNVNILKGIKCMVLVGNYEIIGGGAEKRSKITGLFQVQNYMV